MVLVVIRHGDSSSFPDSPLDAPEIMSCLANSLADRAHLQSLLNPLQTSRWLNSSLWSPLQSCDSLMLGTWLLCTDGFSRKNVLLSLISAHSFHLTHGTLFPRASNYLFLYLRLFKSWQHRYRLQSVFLKSRKLKFAFVSQISTRWFVNMIHITFFIRQEVSC